jgi:hypothetical protein
MLNKAQIRERIQWILEHRDVANKTWFLEQLESLLSSMDSPEIFVQKMERVKA